MHRRIIAVAILAAAMLVTAHGAPVPAARAAASCEFRLGFAALKATLPAVVGDCLENERHNPRNGDGLQPTTRGMLVWRKADNLTAFTDGYRSWIVGPAGIVSRLGTERFDWEADTSDLARLTRPEAALADAIDTYRASHGLQPIPRSAALTRVAKTHVRDLQRHTPTQPCNLHSWSNDGSWSPVCYTSDHAQAAGMRSKPLEIADYSSAGYEIALTWVDAANRPASDLLGVWRGSPQHDATIREIGVWAGRRFEAMGVGVFGDYAVVWFGESRDPAGEPELMR